VLVEDALVEERRQAHVVDVALIEVDAPTKLAAGDVRILADERLEQVRRLDGNRTPRPGHVEVRTDVPPEVREPEARATAERRRADRRSGRGRRRERRALHAGDRADPEGGS